MKTLREQIAAKIRAKWYSSDDSDWNDSAQVAIDIIKANLPPVLTDEEIVFTACDTCGLAESKGLEDKYCRNCQKSIRLVAQAQRDSILKWMDQPLNPEVEKGNE